jgi:hypothetical protein
LDAPVLTVLARSSAVSIVDRHAPGIRDREALIDAIARLALIGLENSVGLWMAEQAVAAALAKPSSIP